MAYKEKSVSPVISNTLCRYIFTIGSIISVGIYLSTFVPRGIPINRLAVGVLMIIAIAAFSALCAVDVKYRAAPWTLLISVGATIWLATLVIYTGGPKSDFFPLFFLILILAGATSEKKWHVFAIALFVCVGYVSHVAVYGVMRDSFRDFLLIRVPVYFTAAYSTYFLVAGRLQAVRETGELVKLTDVLDYKARQMESLFNISKKIGSKLTVKSVLITVVEDAVESLSVTAASVHLFTGHNGTMKIASSHGLSKKAIESLDDIKVGEGAAGWVAMTSEPLQIDDASADSRFDGFRGTRISSVLSVPMVLGARTIGVFTVYSADKRGFSDDDIGFLSALAGQTAVAEETARLHEETEKLSLIDELTSLYNVRKLKTSLREEIGRSKRFGHNFSFIMADIDFFKNYNDRYGHKAGDAVLRNVAFSIVSASRSVDMSFRYGGEEFCLILPETDRAEALEVAERIRKTVEDLPIVGEEKQPSGKLTISMGISVYPEDTTDRDALIEIADKALYTAKRAGRNRIVVAEKTLSQVKTATR